MRGVVAAWGICCFYSTLDAGSAGFGGGTGGFADFAGIHGEDGAAGFFSDGRIDNMLKDLETVQAAALGKRIPMPVTGLITELHRLLVAAGRGAADSAEYVRMFEGMGEQ